jgi:predicted transcriptional regulator
VLSYRSAAKFQFVSKLLEETVAKQVVQHLTTRKTYAYRRFHSCETTITHVFNDIYQGMNDKKVTLLVLFVLSAAFDTDDHSV